MADRMKTEHHFILEHAAEIQHRVFALLFAFPTAYESPRLEHGRSLVEDFDTLAILLTED